MAGQVVTHEIRSFILLKIQGGFTKRATAKQNLEKLTLFVLISKNTQP